MTNFVILYGTFRSIILLLDVLNERLHDAFNNTLVVLNDTLVLLIDMFVVLNGSLFDSIIILWSYI